MPGAAGMRVTPELARQQMQALKRMRPEQLEELAAVAERSGPAVGGSSAADAQRAAEMLKVLAVLHSANRQQDGRLAAVGRNGRLRRMSDVIAVLTPAGESGHAEAVH